MTLTRQFNQTEDHQRRLRREAGDESASHQTNNDLINKTMHMCVSHGKVRFQHRLFSLFSHCDSLVYGPIEAQHVEERECFRAR